MPAALDVARRPLVLGLALLQRHSLPSNSLAVQPAMPRTNLDQMYAAV
jgi:hypothetical protein